MKQIEGVDEGTTPFVPTEEWMDAFQTQTTAELVANAEDFAAMRARGVAKVGGIADEFYVRELVLDALEDTVTGVVAWDPAKHPLENHVIDVIRFRTRHHRKRALRFRRQSIDDASVGAMAEIEATMASNAATSEDHAEALATETLSQLRQFAKSDHSDHMNQSIGDRTERMGR